MRVLWRDILRLISQLIHPVFVEMGALFGSLVHIFIDLFNALSTRFFSYRARAAKLRTIILISVLALMWAGYAYVVQLNDYQNYWPSIINAQVRYTACMIKATLFSDDLKPPEQRCYRYEIGRSFTFRPLIFEAPFQLLFAPVVFRHVLVISFGIWLSFKTASRYTHSLFDTAEPAVGEHYILQTALINPYNTLHIRDFKIDSKEEQLPIHKIGGPGRVSVHLEYAALFERKDGMPHVIGPTGKYDSQTTWVDGFERLRTFIDLRDQHEKFTIPGRSQDGIRLTTEDIQVVYSVFRNYQKSSLERPYPFDDPNAIRKLVYDQAAHTWTTSVKVQIQGELLDFFAKNKLNEFLSMIQEPELKSIEQREEELAKASQRLIGEENHHPSQEAGSNPIPSFVDRPKITDQFYKAAEERYSIRGTQINWVGIGTWSFPSQIIQSRHHDAWRIMLENQVRGSQQAVQGVRKQQYLTELLKLVQILPLVKFQTITQTNSSDPIGVVRELFSDYYAKFREALEDYEREIDVVGKQSNLELDEIKKIELETRYQRLHQEKVVIERVLEYLSRFVYRWLDIEIGRRDLNDQQS